MAAAASGAKGGSHIHIHVRPVSGAPTRRARAWWQKASAPPFTVPCLACANAWVFASLSALRLNVECAVDGSDRNARTS